MNPAIAAELAGFAHGRIGSPGVATTRFVAVTRVSHLSHYLLILAAAWMLAMTWRVYPQFKDTLKVEDRLVTLDDYVEESCSQRIGPAAASCVEESRLTGQRLVAQQQGRALLFVLAPLLAYIAIYLPWRGVAARSAREGRSMTPGE